MAEVADSRAPVIHYSEMNEVRNHHYATIFSNEQFLMLLVSRWIKT